MGFIFMDENANRILHEVKLSLVQNDNTFSDEFNKRVTIQKHDFLIINSPLYCGQPGVDLL